jgi:hypothetical protein
MEVSSLTAYTPRPVGRLCMNITGAKNIVDARLQSLLRSRIENPSTSTDKPVSMSTISINMITNLFRG